MAADMRGAHAARLIADGAALHRAKVLKQEGKAWVRLADPSEDSVDRKSPPIVVKCRPIGSLRRRVASVLGLGHAHRQWRGAQRVRDAGVETGTPLAMARADIDDVPCELLALEYVEGPTLLEVMSQVTSNASDAPSVRQQHAIARAAAESVKKLLAARRANRDHKPSNLVVVGGASAEPKIAVIDCVAIKRFGWFGIDEYEGEEMLASLMIEAIGCGCRPRGALWMRALRAAARDDCNSRAERRANIRALFQDVVDLIGAHGDPTPLTNPLAPAQRIDAPGDTI